jgi:hypothetical protein
MQNNTPLFSPTTHALMRAPTPEEQKLAESKAQMLRILRNPSSTTKDCQEAESILRELWAETEGDPADLEDILATLPARREVTLRDILVFDLKHPKEPPEGFVKAMLVTEKDSKMTMLAVNVPKDATDKIPRYSKNLYGVVLQGPVLLEDGEWRDPAPKPSEEKQ